MKTGGIEPKHTKQLKKCVIKALWYQVNEETWKTKKCKGGIRK